MRLGHEPRKTIGKIAQDVKALGTCLGYAAAELSEHSPYAYKADMQLDLIEGVIDLFKNGKITSGKRRFLLRAERNKAGIESVAAAVLNPSLDVISNMAAKSFEDNIADITEFGVDALITAKTTEAVMQLAQFTSNVLLQGGREILEVIPTNLLDSPVAYMQTSTGEIIAVAEKTGEDINIVASKQIAVNRAVQVEKISEKKKLINAAVDNITKINEREVIEFSKSMEPHFNYDKVINVERLKTITDVPQINLYKDFTNNFDPTLVAQLKPEEILYLNLCDWLYPKSIEINARIKNIGLTIIDPNNKNNIIYIEDLDIFHSFLGDMKPGSIADATSGGHCFLSELKGATLAVEEIIPFKNGFFDMRIRHLKGEGKFRPKTYFPSGKNIEQCADMIIDVIKKPQFIENITGARDINQSVFKVIDSYDQTFCLRITNGVVKCYPLAF